ncbi:MAG TPA: Crp/Fnr family transcriptional regulator [bacterium]|nr:Crp/Fnr family transcriptional regulator [bacterium]
MGRATKAAKKKVPPHFDFKSFVAGNGDGRAIVELPENTPLFSQGDRADQVFYVLKGKVKLTVVSAQGKEAVIAVLGPDAFVGEGCLAGQRLRMATATAMTDGTVVRIKRESMVRLLHEQPAFSELFTAYLLSRNIRVEEDLVDQLFNSSEKRLARMLLLLAHVGKQESSETVVPKVSQELLADMIGTTRARVSYFMNKFRKLGLIEYNGGLRVNSSLLNIVLHD